MTTRGPLVIVEIALSDAAVVKRLASRMMCTDCGVNRQDDGEFATCHDCGGPLVPRADDREQVVRNRLDVYRKQTAPLVSYYEARPTFCRVNGAQLFDHVVAGPRARGRARRWESPGCRTWAAPIDIED